MEEAELTRNELLELSRQEAFALEARLLIRLAPAFEIIEENKEVYDEAIVAYVQLIALLEAVSLGKKNIPNKEASLLYSKFTKVEPTQRGRFLYEAVTLTADAVADTGLVRFSVQGPGPHVFGDLTYALMYGESTFHKWAFNSLVKYNIATRQDYMYIMKGRLPNLPPQWNPHVAAPLFSMPLWPMGIPEEWSDYINDYLNVISKLNLTEFGNRYEKLLGKINYNVKDNQNSEKARVFLCHSSGDKEKVRQLFYKLKNDGFDPWLDEISILPGQRWNDEIIRAVRNAHVVAVCLSNSSINKTGFVQKEIKVALDAADERPDGTIYIMPIRLEECIVPERLGHWQWVNLFDENGYEKLLASLRTHFSK